MKNKKVKVADLVLETPKIGIHPEARIIIAFADHGQDFLHWQLNSVGHVVQSTPFQTEIWAGTYVDIDQMKVGHEPAVILEGKLTYMKYKIIGIAKVNI